MDITPYSNFLVYLLAGMGYLALFIFVYIRITSYAEIKLIREGNTAAAISLAGAIIGFCIPLHKAIAQSMAALDLLIWATIALIVQIVAFLIFIKLLPKFASKVEEGNVAKATLLAALAIAIGLLNSASMTM